MGRTERKLTHTSHDTRYNTQTRQAIKAFLREHFPTLKVPARDPVPTVQEVEELHKLKLAKGQPSDLEGACVRLDAWVDGNED